MRYAYEKSILRTLFAGISGGVALNAAMLLTFKVIGLGWNGDGILLNPAIQSKKLIDAWTKIEPLPLVVTNPGLMIMITMFFGILHAFLYRWLSPIWPTGIKARALRFGGLLFLMTFLFWEFFTPFNQFGEPLSLIALELVFWAIIALAEAAAIATVMETKIVRI